MARKTIYIVLGALAVFGLLFLLWSWFFSGSSSPSTSGTLGSASDTTQNAGGGDQNTNGQSTIGSNGVNGSQNLTGNTGSNGGIGGSGGTNGVSTNGSNTNTGSTGGGTIGTSRNGSISSNGSLGGGGTNASNNNSFRTAPGVTWLGGSSFNPTGINGVAGGAGGFAPTITSPNTGTNGSVSLVTALAATAIAGSLSCAIQSGILLGSTAGATTAATAAATAVGTTVAFPPGTSPGLNVVADYSVRASLTKLLGVQAVQSTRNAGKDTVSFQQCIINVIAKTALQQITISVVNWINSGFNGSPSFVTNFQQFFTNVADAAAGQFIQGSGLAFLCSPFKAQIKIAIAQSYANRSAQSCTLSRIINNVNSFMNGNFAQGGWGGFVSFTTVPTNNPYGAFAYGQLGLQNAQANALANSKNNISPTGFLNLQQLSGCTDPTQNGISGGFSLGSNPQAAIAGGKDSLPPGCKAKVITPGGAIADSLGAVSKSGVDQLGLASSLDQIITALTNQLMVKVLQGGLTSLSQPTTQTPADIAAQSTALSMLTDMQNRTTLAQQLGAIFQGSISDIQSTQANVNGLFNCWSSVASTTNDAAATTHAADANATMGSLNSKVTLFNNAITNINNGIAILNQFESDVSTASSQADVARISANYNAAVAAGTFVSQADVTTAQQNRVTLQSQMATLNQSTQTGLAQCNAFGH